MQSTFPFLVAVFHLLVGVIVVIVVVVFRKLFSRRRGAGAS